MKLIKPSIEFMGMTEHPLQAIELAGRTCYKSEDKITGDSSEQFVRMLIKRGHEAMIEHASASYRFVCDRGVTHEIVRHRLFSYGQESTRYCNYKGGVTFIAPLWFSGIDEIINVEPLSMDSYSKSCVPLHGTLWYWLQHMLECEHRYKSLLKDGWTPQQARSVLPNALKTEIVITGNLREWRHFFRLRCAKAAHPQMQEVANMALADIRKRIPIIFED